MARRKKGEAPQMRHHKASGQAYVSVFDRQIYLGPWGSPEARRQYRMLISRWEAVNRPAVPAVPIRPIGGRLRVTDLVAAFVDWASTRYRRKDSKPTSELSGIKYALTPLIAAHGAQYADDILGRDLRDLTISWKAAQHCRTTINTYLRRVKRMFKWAAQYELIEPSTAARIALVPGLTYGEAHDNDDVQPVPLRDLVKVLKQLDKTRPMVAAMIRLQYYCGARPGEVCALRGDEIKRGTFRVGGQTVRVPEGLLVFFPSEHKTIKKGQVVFYTLGPRAQNVMSPWLNGDDFVFPGKMGDHIHYSTYALAILRAAEEVGAGHWSPNQLRHNFLTRWDSLAGIEAASAAVRHKKLSTTAIYIQRDLKKVGAMAAKIG